VGEEENHVAHLVAHHVDLVRDKVYDEGPASPGRGRQAQGQMKTERKSIAWLFFAVAAIAATILVAALLDQPREVVLDIPEIDEGGAAVDLDMARIEADVRSFASADSRLSGHAGAAHAFERIRRELAAAGLGRVTVQEFPVAVPTGETAHLAMGGVDEPVTVPLHPLWPNLARTCMTPPGGLRGTLVDAGGGTEADLQGKDLNGAIVVMDWDCDLEWLSVPEFGGRALVFRGERPADGRLARRKFLSMPVDIPRFYVAPHDLPALDRALAGKTAATLVSDDRWQEVTARNILVEVAPGPSGADDDPDLTPIVFHAYYDSISVVPGLAPGAEQSCGAATLLELCRVFAAHPAPRPVHALFTGGHGQSLAGMTHYVTALRESGENVPGLMVGLDLSSRSDTLGVFCLGHFRGQYENLIRHKFSTLGAKLDEFARRAAGVAETESTTLPSFVDGINLTSGRGWWSFFPYLAPFESEIPTLAGIPGITLATVNDDRRLVDTPDDTAGNLRFDMLGRQLLARRGEHAGLLAIARAVTQWKGPFVSSPLVDRWATIKGRAVWLDQRRNYTPDEPLHGATVFLKMGRGDKHLLGTRGMTPVMTGTNGQYTISGLIRSMANWQFNNCEMEVYGTADPGFLERNPGAIKQYLQVVGQAESPATNSESPSQPIRPDGSVIYAVDMARPSDYPWAVEAEKEVQHVNVVCFPCRTFSLLGLTDPRGYIPLTDVKVLDAATTSPPFQFGLSASDSPHDQTENLVTVWTDPTLRILLTLGVGFQGKRLILINNSPELPEGEGFVVEELTTLPSMILQGAEDMWTLDETRIQKLERNGVNNPRLRDLHEQSGTLIATAREALESRDYRAYRMAAEKGWAIEGKAYGEALGMINNMIHGVLFYLALLLPLSYCLERLLIASETIKKRIIWIGGIFAGSFLLLALVHPAFRFTMTPLLVLLAFIIVTLVVTVSVIIVGKMDALLQERRTAAMGRHEDQQRKGGIAVRALDLGMSNIRRRPQRGVLTGLSVVMVTFILLSFTSLVPVTSISRLAHPRGTPTYRGLLARDRAWNPLPDALEQSLRRNFEGTQLDGDGRREPTPDPSQEGNSGVIPSWEGCPKGGVGSTNAVVAARGWFFSDDTGLLSQVDLVAGQGVGDARPASCTVPALVGMQAAEAQVTPVADCLVAGNWFTSEAENGIILSAYVAGQLGYDADDIGAPVRIFGEELALAGIVDGERFDAMHDVDGEPLTPVNFVLQRERSAQAAGTEEGQGQADTLEEYVHYSVDQVAIVPFRYAKRLGARVRSVAVRAPDGMPVAEEAEGYAKRSNLTILGADADGVTLYAALDTSQLSAAWQIIVPMFLGFVMILGTMLGSVYERQGEIFVYNSVGLSPTNVSSLFLAESTVYAIVGAGLGYLLGQTSSKVLQMTGMLSGLTLNYTAGSTVFVTLLAMLMVFLSAIYPARKAFRAAIPDLEEEQDADDIGTAGDAISFYLPFVATAQHVEAMQAYLAEFLESIQGVTVGQLAVDNLQAVREEDEHGMVPMLRFRAWMAPFDLGVSHDAEMRIVYRADRGVHQYHLTARRFSGDRQNWHRLTPRFITAIRKQLLLWRVLSAEDYQKYEQRGRILFGSGEGESGQ